MVKKIQNYCLEEVIGEGEFGKVYKATNQRTADPVAIKVIRIEKFKMSPKLQQCTINQVQTLSKIESNEHIVKFVQILKTSNNYYFVYQFCNGGTLEKMIKNQGHFQQTKALYYFMDMLKAFKVLTKNNIMHRDIKPGNILLHNGIIKIADFGFCKPLSSSKDLAQTMLGSPIYMAPEILRGEVYTIKADIWSLGVVLYEMLFGYCPFEQKSIAKLLTLLEEGTLSFPRNINNISHKAQDLLRRMLVKDHFKRISWEQLFEYQLNSEGELINKKDPKLSLQKKILENKDQSSNQINTNVTNYSFLKKMNQTFDYTEVKKPLNSQSSPLNPPNQTTRDNSNINTHNSSSAIRKSLVRSLLAIRSKLQQGTKLIFDVLQKSKTKTCIYASCILMKKVKQYCQMMQKQLKKCQNDKQNEKGNNQLKKTTTIIKQQLSQIKLRSIYFEEQSKSNFEEEKKTIENYAEQTNALKEKEKLIHLLEILDFLQPEYIRSEAKEYNKLERSSLVEEFNKKIKVI